jgi:hypothetical protein
MEVVVVVVVAAGDMEEAAMIMDMAVGEVGEVGEEETVGECH